MFPDHAPQRHSATEIFLLYCAAESAITRMWRRATRPRPPDLQQVIEEQRREIRRLREDLRHPEAERQRRRRDINATALLVALLTAPIPSVPPSLQTIPAVH